MGMAQVVALEINLFDPDCMVLGGGLLQMEGFPCKQLEALVHRYARKPYPERDLRLRYSRPNQENGPWARPFMPANAWQTAISVTRPGRPSARGPRFWRTPPCPPKPAPGHGGRFAH